MVLNKILLQIHKRKLSRLIENDAVYELIIKEEQKFDKYMIKIFKRQNRL